jgi:hypothetical protein
MSWPDGAPHHRPRVWAPRRSPVWLPPPPTAKGATVLRQTLDGHGVTVDAPAGAVDWSCFPHCRRVPNHSCCVVLFPRLPPGGNSQPCGRRGRFGPVEPPTPRGYSEASVSLTIGQMWRSLDRLTASPTRRVALRGCFHHRKLDRARRGQSGLSAAPRPAEEGSSFHDAMIHENGVEDVVVHKTTRRRPGERDHLHAG